MMRGGSLDHKVTVFARAGSATDLGDWVAGVSRRAGIASVSIADQIEADAPTGLDLADITVRACAQTRAWSVDMVLREDFGPAGLSRVFDIVGPGQPDVTGAWLTFRCSAGSMHLGGG